MVSPSSCRDAFWRHFVHDDNQMVYDYWWGEPGFRWLPAPDEIAREFPNPPGWGTGMENCALNAAQVLPGALLRHTLAPDSRSQHEAQTLLAGLLRLFRVAADPGFLPRGVALDGVSHYPNSSADQYTMVLSALHAYFAHPLATQAERQQIRTIWHQVLLRWERHGWEDRREDGGQAMYGDMDRIAPDRGGRLLAALLGGWVVTGDNHWRDVYHHKLEQDDGARLRTGLPSASGALYVLDQNQVAWRLLWELETDARIRQRYEQMLQQTADAVVHRLAGYEQFDAAEHSRRLAACDWNWRNGCVPQETRSGPGPNQGAAYNARLRQRAPVVEYEHELAQSPWEAAHILALSEHDQHARLLHEHLPAMLAAYPWDRLALSWSLYDVESTWWRAVQSQQPRKHNEES